MEILTHPKTSGHSIYQGKIVKRDVYPPILHEETRQALITLFSNPARKCTPGNTPRWLGSLIYLCGRCKDGTTVTVNYRNGRPIYRCPAHGHVSWSAALVDGYVQTILNGMLRRDRIIELIRPAQKIDAEAMREEIKVLERKKMDAGRKNMLGQIDDAVFDTMIATADQRIADIWAELSTGTAEDPLIEFALSEDTQKTWDTQSLGRQREILRRLLVVTLPPIGRGRLADVEIIDIRRPA